MLAYIADERGYKRGWVANKYKEKFGVFPPWGRRAADPAVAGGSKVGALAHDRVCAETGRMKSATRTAQDQRPVCTAHDRNVAVASLSRALSLTGRRILDRIEIEFASHGGRDNGKLPVTYQNLKDFGICNRTDIARGKRELCALGFVECRRGHAGNGEFRRPTLFRLTYLPAYAKGPTHEWRQIGTVEEAESIAKKVRRTIKSRRRKNKTPVTENVTRSSRKTRLYPVTENVTMPRKHRSRFPRRLSRQSSHLEGDHRLEDPDLPPCPDLTAADAVVRRDRRTKRAGG